MASGGLGSGEHHQSALVTPLLTPPPGDIIVVENAPVDRNNPGHSSSPALSKLEGSVQVGASGGWNPTALEWWSTIGLALAFVLVAASSEVLLMYSQKNSGKPGTPAWGIGNNIYSPSGFSIDIHLTDNEISRGRQFAKVFLP